MYLKVVQSYCIFTFIKNIYTKIIKTIDLKKINKISTVVVYLKNLIFLLKYWIFSLIQIYNLDFLLKHIKNLFFKTNF